MDYVHKEKGFLSTSTPIQKPCKNGQRSCNKLRWASRTNSLSPIKEVTPFKQKSKNFVDSVKHQTFENSIGNLDAKLFNSIEVVKELGDSGYGSYNNLRRANRTISLSPIKEITPFKKRLEKFIDSEGPQILNSTGYLDERQFNTIKVAKELDFNNTSDSLTESCHITISDYYITNTEEDTDSQNGFPDFQLKDLSEDKIIVFKKKPNNQQKCVINSEQHIFENTPFPLLTGNRFFPEDSDNYKLRDKKVDFFGALRERNLPFIITYLLSFIPTEDLGRICCVNKTWNSILQSDIKACRRLKNFLKYKSSQKENKHPAVSVITPDGRSCLRQGEHKSAFCNVSNVVTFMKQPLKKNCNTKFDSFVKAGVNEKCNLLMKCPRCDYAAKNLTGDEYICTECNYEFCKKCQGPFLKNHICSKSMVSMVIGSRKSKRNLKRL